MPKFCFRKRFKKNNKNLFSAPPPGSGLSPRGQHLGVFCTDAPISVWDGTASPPILPL